MFDSSTILSGWLKLVIHLIIYMWLSWRLNILHTHCSCWLAALQKPELHGWSYFRWIASVLKAVLLLCSRWFSVEPRRHRQQPTAGVGSTQDFSTRSSQNSSEVRPHCHKYKTVLYTWKYNIKHDILKRWHISLL